MSIQRKLAASFLAFFCLLATILPADCQPASSRVQLVLLLIVDQFNSDYLARYNDHLSNKGFKYLIDRGALFTNCRYKQATTVTAVGHSVIASGAHPWATGVVSNEWYDRRKGSEVQAVTDDTVQMVGGNGPGASCRSMTGTTFGDQIKLVSNGRSRVFSVSIKDRGALFTAGKMGNGAFWFDSRTGNFVSSSQFGTSLPNWLRTFNDQHYADQYHNKVWQRLLPENAYTASTRDDYPQEGSLAGDGKQFPHVLTGGVTAPSEPFYSMFTATPFANDVLGELARYCFEQEALGQHGETDVLAVSFSAIDPIGHTFGPYSQEAEDAFLRLDQTVARLLRAIESKVNLSNCLVVVTGDHGSAPIPEFMKERGQAQILDAGRIDPKGFRTTLNNALSARLGQGEWVSAFTPPNLYLNLSEIDKQKYRQPEVEALAAKLARAVPGIGEVYTAAQFYSNQLPSGPFGDLVRRSYFWGRSGELYVMVKPNYVWSGGATGTSHGSAYSYDRQVPLILAGNGISPGRYAGDCSPADIAATLCALLNITTPPLSEGRALQEAFGRGSEPAAYGTP